MRKEQLKALQGKQKLNSSKIEDFLSDITGPLVDPTGGKMSDDSDKVLKQAQHDDSGMFVSQQSHPSRPRVPPGFVNCTVDKSSSVKNLVHGEPLEVSSPPLPSEPNNSWQFVPFDDCESNCYDKDHSIWIPKGQDAGAMLAYTVLCLRCK